MKTQQNTICKIIEKIYELGYLVQIVSFIDENNSLCYAVDYNETNNVIMCFSTIAYPTIEEALTDAHQAIIKDSII